MAKSFLDKSGYPRGLRNNNPGNIMGTDNWREMIGTDDRGFARFPDVSWGIRALGIDLTSKMENGYDTIGQIGKIITRYAPPYENDTEAYITRVEYYTGIDRYETITADQNTLQQLIRAIMNVELGESYSNLITDADIKQGMSLMSGSGTQTAAAAGVGVTVGLFLFALYLLATMPKAKVVRA